MNRQTLLLWLLALLIVFGMPFSFMDRALIAVHKDLAAAEAAQATARSAANTLREQEKQIARRAEAAAAIKPRLIAEQPFATIQAELATAAQRSGMTIAAQVLEGPVSVPDIPGVVQFKATLQVTGEVQQYLEFLRLLEEHQLLIEIPEVDLRLRTAAAQGTAPAAGARGVAAGGAPQVQQSLTLGFLAAQAEP